MAADDYSLVPRSPGQIAPAGIPSAGVLSAIVQQSLALAREEEAPAAAGPAVLFADWDADFADLVESQWRALAPDAPLKFLRCGEAHEIVQIAAREPFDLAVITLNNVFGIGPGVGERLKVVLKIMRQLKDAYGKPIIALSGYYDADDLPERAAEAGADVFRDRADTLDLAELIQLYLNRERANAACKKNQEAS